MLGKLLLLFTIVPAVELYLLIKIGQQIGALSTLAIMVATGMLGAALARAEGLRVLRAWQDALAGGRVPEDGIVSGALLLLGGALLISPGVVTDAAGLLLLVPFVRRRVAHYVMRRLQRGIEKGAIRVVHTEARVTGDPFGFRGPRSGMPPRRGVIDVEGETVSEDRSSSSPPSIDTRTRD